MSILLFNGKIYTQDQENSICDSVLISGDKIKMVGFFQDLKPFIRKHTKKIDLHGRVVLPGFTDSHFHFYEWAANFDSVDLSGAHSFKEIEKKLRIKAESIPEDQWILGYGFNESEWQENRIPNRNDLDKILLHNPVCIWRCDLHVGVANSRALSLAKINRNSPNPSQGKIDKDSTGNPTGILKELALNIIKKIIPKPGEKKILSNMAKGIKQLHKFGITSIHDVRLMGGLDGQESLMMWQKLYEKDNLNIRCHVSLPGEMTEKAVDLGLRTGFGNNKLKIGSLKFFADGGMGARTAWMIDKYVDAEYGMPLTKIEDIEKAILKAEKVGLSVMVHSIGDRANKEVISMFERIEKQNPIRPNIPHRVEHVQMIRPDDLTKMSKLKSVVTSCQPNNLSLDISMIEMSVGDKSKYTYTLKSILDNGLLLILNSDAPVCDPNPFIGIYSAVTRKKMDNTPDNGWHLEQALSVQDAVKGYTISPARAGGVDKVLGSITKGKFADIIVLEDDIFSIDPVKIADSKINMTIFNGKIVYES